MLKRVCSLVLVLVLAFSLVACAKTEENPEKKTFKIGVVISMFNNDYLSYVRKGIEKEAKAAGVEVEILDANNDQAKQNEQVDILLNKGVDAMIISACETAANATMVEKCKAKGVPCSLVTKKPTQDVIDSYDKCWYVGAATKQPGECQAQMIVEDFKANPKMDKNGDGKLQYLYLFGMKGQTNAEDRYTGLNEVFDKEKFQREELDMQEAKWNNAKAKDITDAWLMKYGDSIEAIISQNDAMALGAIESIGGKHNIPVYGINALEMALPELDKGTLTGTVMSDMISEGAMSLRVLVNFLNGKDVYTDIKFPNENKCVSILGQPIRKDNKDVAAEMYK